MKKQEAAEALRALAAEIDYLENTIMTLSWDMRVNLPRDAGEYRGDVIGFLTGEAYKRKTSERMNEILGILEEGFDTEDDPVLSAMIRHFRKEYRYLKEVPADLSAAYAAHKLKTEVVWQQARAADDYEMIIPWAEKEFGYLKEIAAAHGFSDDPLTGLMSSGDPGLTREKVDALFGELKAFELPFIERLKSSPCQIKDEVLPGPFPKEKQRELCKEILSIAGYNFDRGRIDESAHPYTTANDPYDVRFTTRYEEGSFLPSLVSSLHEGGHGMHGQNSMPALRRTTLENAHYDAVCESQSRFIENVIGRSREFWEFCMPIARRYFPQLDQVSPDRIFRSLGSLKISPDRLNADELTYNLHIMIRYELEKMLFDGEITFAELPHYWNEKYREYLGVVPKNNAEGVLADMHWYSGYVGYFQSYVMGNFYDGHYWAAMKKDIPDMYEQVGAGRFGAITAWLREHIQQYGGMYEPAELLRRIDGGGLTAGHYIDYIRERYGELYGI